MFSIVDTIFDDFKTKDINKLSRNELVSIFNHTIERNIKFQNEISENNKLNQILIKLIQNNNENTHVELVQPEEESDSDNSIDNKPVKPVKSDKNIKILNSVINENNENDTTTEKKKVKKTVEKEDDNVVKKKKPVEKENNPVVEKKKTVEKEDDPVVEKKKTVQRTKKVVIKTEETTDDPMIEKKKPVRKTTKKETDDIKPTLITDGDNSDEEVIEKPVKNETNSSIAKNVLAKKKKTKT